MRNSILFAASYALAAAASAQTSYPMLSHVHPAGVQRGTTTTITVAGKENFAGAYKLLTDGNAAEFKAEFIVAKAPATPTMPTGKTKAEPKPGTVNQIQIKLTVAAGAKLGVREFRVATPRGVSSIGLLVVGDEPEVVEVDPNDTPAQAQAVKLPVTVNGRVEKIEDVDWYKFQAAAGEEVSFHVIAARLQDKIHDLQEHVDPMLVLTDSNGTELAGEDDYYFADPYFTYKFTKAGEYRVAIRDIRYKGNAAWTYRLTMTKRPFVLNVFPAAVRAGKSAVLTPVGWKADAPMPTVKMEIPAEWEPGLREVQLATAGGTSNLVPIWITDLPMEVEQEPNDVAAKAGPLAIPGGVNGRIGKETDADWFRFTAKAGRAYVFEAVARRYMSELDSYVSIHEVDGRQLVANDDTGGKDSILTWTAPRDGDFLVRITDIHGRGGAKFVYFLTARPALPDFNIRCDPDKAQIGPGTSTAWYPIIERTGGFTGPVKVEVHGLPAGVTANPLTIAAGLLQGCIVLTAAADAKLDAATVRIVAVAEAEIDGKKQTLTRAATAIQEIYTPGGGRGRYPVGLQTVSVTEPSDVTVTTATKEATLKAGGTVRIDVEIKRSPGYTGPVSLDVPLRHLATVYANPLPTGVTIDEPKSRMRLGPNDTKGWVILKAADNAAPVSNAPISVMAYVSINFVVKVGYSTPAINLTVAPK